MMRVRALLLAAVIAALAAWGCATAGARAKAPTGPVPLEAPAPPPRVIVPPEPEISEPPVPTPEPESAAPRTPHRPPVAGPAKTEPKVDPPRAAQQAPTATLQQELPTSPADIVRRVREQLGQAQTDLRRVDYRALSADGKSQYDTATRFVEQAEQALREKNLVFAAKVAEKAAVLAASLVGRLRP
jgi:hypothetical protein